MNEIITKIKNAASIAILPHKNEDADALGSCFALAKALERLGKDVKIYVSGEIEKRLNFIGSDYEIYDGVGTYNHDLCISVDSGDINRLGDRQKIFNNALTTANIDHHYSNTNYADANYVDGDASSAGEIIYSFIKAMDIELDKEIARYLYIAICSDTGCFRFSNVSPKTMQTAAELLKFGIDNAEIARLLFESESLKAVRIKAEAAGKMESFYGGALRMVFMTADMYERYDISETDAPNLVDVARAVENTEIAICFKEQKDGIRLNLRSNGECDVSQIAKKFGGGGHIKAAGCTVTDMGLEELKEVIVKECGYLNKYQI